MSTLCVRESAWQRDLIEFHPFVRFRAAAAFGHLHGADHDDAISDVTADVAVALAQLASRRKTHRGLIPPLVDFAIRHRHAGRRVGTSTNRQDLQSPARQDVQPLHSLDARSDESGVSWHDVLPDSRQADPAEIACARIDVGTWLSRLPTRLREIAESFAAGERPGDLARKLGISRGRVSQLRDELRSDWTRFAGEAA